MCYGTKIQTFSRTKHSQEPSHTIVVSYLSLIKKFIIMWHLSLFYSSSHTLLFEPTNIYAFMPSLVLEQESISLLFLSSLLYISKNVDLLNLKPIIILACTVAACGALRSSPGAAASDGVARHIRHSVALPALGLSSCSALVRLAPSLASSRLGRAEKASTHQSTS